MSKVIMIVTVLAIAILSGCAGKKTVSVENQINKSMQIPTDWLNPKVEHPNAKKGYVFGEGAYAVSKTRRDPYFAKAQADFRAQQDILRKLSLMIAAEIGDDQSSYGTGEQVDTDAASRAAKAISILDLSGTEIIKREYLDGRIYSRARYSLSPENRAAILDVLRPEVMNADAGRSKEEAEKNWNKLETRIIKRFNLQEVQ